MKFFHCRPVRKNRIVLCGKKPFFSYIFRNVCKTLHTIRRSKNIKIYLYWSIFIYFKLNLKSIKYSRMVSAKRRHQCLKNSNPNRQQYVKYVHLGRAPPNAANFLRSNSLFSWLEETQNIMLLKLTEYLQLLTEIEILDVHIIRLERWVCFAVKQKTMYVSYAVEYSLT